MNVWRPLDTTHASAASTFVEITVQAWLPKRIRLMQFRIRVSVVLYVHTRFFSPSFCHFSFFFDTSLRAAAQIYLSWLRHYDVFARGESVFYRAQGYTPHTQHLTLRVHNICTHRHLLRLCTVQGERKAHYDRQL